MRFLGRNAPGQMFRSTAVEAMWKGWRLRLVCLVHKFKKADVRTWRSLSHFDGEALNRALH